jgi:hypothetical protein
MAFPSTQSFHHERNIFANLFSPMSREINDAKTNAPVLYFKMKMMGDLQVYTDKTMQGMLLNCTKPQKIGFTWNVFDAENGNTHLGAIKGDFMKSALRFGKEAWTVTDPNGTPLLLFNADVTDSTTKHMLDNLTGFYNPTHQYNIWNAQEKPVARIWSKQGLWRFKYDLVIEDRATETERKMATAVFAAMTLLLKK